MLAVFCILYYILGSLHHPSVTDGNENLV